MFKKKLSFGLVATGILLAVICFVLLGGKASAKDSLEAHTSIVGGERVSAPSWSVALFNGPPGQRSSMSRYVCSGTLVAPDVVLTAEHCLLFWKEKGLNVSAGADRLSGNYTVEVINKISTPLSYSGNQSFNWRDLALLKLKTPVLNVPIQLAPVSQSLQPKNIITKYGYGSDSSGDIPGYLKSMSGLVQSDINCYKALKKFIDFKNYSEFENFTCFTGYNKGATCYGDSGSPATANILGREVLIGVTESGDQTCGDFALSIDIGLDNAEVNNWVRSNTIYLSSGRYDPAYKGNFSSYERVGEVCSASPQLGVNKTKAGKRLKAAGCSVAWKKLKPTRKTYKANNNYVYSQGCWKNKFGNNRTGGKVWNRNAKIVTKTQIGYSRTIFALGTTLPISWTDCGKNPPR